MGDSKLCLLLLVSTLAAAYANEEQVSCPLSQRYKALHKYEYLYVTESVNAINGAAQFQNGPKLSCKVTIEVPRTCSFILRINGCSLSRMVDTDAEGNPVFTSAPGSVDFGGKMEKYPLKVVVEGEYDVQLYPEEGETITVLNIKRGIVSALLVPLEEEDKNNNMPTIHGICKTHSTIVAKKNIATDISLTRDLSKCDKFAPMRDHTSPLAVITGLHSPLAKLIRSSQTCNYKFDNERKYMTFASCTENHILLPFSHKGKYGVTNVGKQSLDLLYVTPYNSRAFNYNRANIKALQMETPEDKTVIQDVNEGLDVMTELVTLPDTDGERRANLFHKLINLFREMKMEALNVAVSNGLNLSRALTFQILAQCGTPECNSGIMRILRTYDSSSLEVDAAVFAMGLISNPSPLLINDMLEMAKHKPSKTIMYALSNIVKRFYKAESNLIPEIHDVTRFMVSQLGDCRGDNDNIYMTLRVIGNMGAAMGEAGLALKTAVIRCVNKPGLSMAVQQAAIQVFRLAPLPEKGRVVLMQVVLDSTSPLQKRIAAYLVLMKEPQHSELVQLAAALPNEQDQQAKSFIISHITNILSSTKPETRVLREKILYALQGNEIGTVMDPTKFSRNYKMGSVEGNMIFEGTSYLPKEIMLEMTLKSFGYDLDMVEIGMDGKGLEPTVEALFGENGFFPDTALKTMYFVSDKLPHELNEVLKNLLPSLGSNQGKRQTTQNIMREIGNNLNKLVRELKAQKNPEAMVYLRLLGNELGYLKTNEIVDMVYSAALMIESSLKVFPMEVMKSVMTKTDNKIFAHYVFMENKFFLPTASGMPLRIALSGTFTPGIKGGLKMSGDMSEISFMPSAGIEFVTQVGCHILDYANSGLEMHTNLFHESGLTAKISMGRNHAKMTIPAPKSPTKLISISNTLVAVTGEIVKTMPPMMKDKVDVNKCTPFFAGMKYCNVLQYVDASSHETAPYFPLTGDSKFAVELHPTGEVTEYSAGIIYELLKDEGHQNVDSMKMVLKAEGAGEAAAIIKYNRGKHVFTADIQVPDYDVEVGLKMGVNDGRTKGKGTHSVSLDLINKNIPQLSLVGRAKVEAMKDAMLQVQLVVPFIKSDLTITTNVKRGEELEFELESDIKLPQSTSVQKMSMKYDHRKIQAEIKCDMNAEIKKILPNTEAVEKMIDKVLHKHVGETDIKIYHILTKSVEATNNYLEKYVAYIPYMNNIRIPATFDISLPEKLFLNGEAKAAYHFNEESLLITIPLPLGGKSMKELNFPPVLTTPHMSLPQFGLNVSSVEIPLPELFVPKSIAVSFPLLGKAEVSAKGSSNLYEMETSMSVGKDAADTQSYSAEFKLEGRSPVDLLSFRIEGSGLLEGTVADLIKANVRSAVSHRFLEASINITEVGSITNKISVKSSSTIQASSPLGLHVNLEHNGLVAVNTEEILADSKLDGSVKAGPIFGNAISTQTFVIFPLRPEAKIDSFWKVDTTIFQAQNTIAATFVNSELSVVSNTNAFEDSLTNVAELSFKESTLSLRCDTNAFALGMKIRNQAQASAGAGAVLFNIETNADHFETHIYSLLSGTFDVNGLVVKNDATVKLRSNEATHKATLKMNKNGLATRGKTTLKSPLTFENTFRAGLDASKATLSINNKASLCDTKLDNANTLTITLSSLDFNSNVETVITENASYTHGITIDLKPYKVSANVYNTLNVFPTNIINEAQLKAEPFKMDLSGSLKAIYGKEEIKHTYFVNYADLKANAKCSTTGKLFETDMSQNTELEVVGLVARITNEASFNSQPINFDQTIQASIIPFDFNLDAAFNADGDFSLYGRQTSEIHGKFLLRAQPLAFATLHEYRALVSHELNNGFSLKTTADCKMDTLLTPHEQKATMIMKSKVNDHAFNSEMTAYHNVERLGVELSHAVLANPFNAASTQNQEYVISGFLKYDKCTEGHIIQLPFSDSVPALLGEMKIIAEALHDYVCVDTKAKLQALTRYVSDFIAGLDIEAKAVQLHQDLIEFTQESFITIEDLEASLLNLKSVVEKTLAEVTYHVKKTVSAIQEMIASRTLTENVIHTVSENLNALFQEYDLKSVIIAVINAIERVIEQIDMQNISDNSFSLLRNLYNKFDAKVKLEIVLRKLKHFIQNFEISTFADYLTTYISPLNLEVLIEEMTAWIPTDVLGTVVECLKELIENFDILEKVNRFHAKMRETIIMVGADKLEAILEKVVELIKQLKINDTLQLLANNLISIDIPTKPLRDIAIQDMIQQLNLHLNTILQNLRSFNYNSFADEVNALISDYTSRANQLIKEFEIPKKVEAMTEFVNFFISSAMGYFENLREVKVVELWKSVKDLIDHTILNDLKVTIHSLKQKITEMDVKTKITSVQQLVQEYYSNVMSSVAEILSHMFEISSKMVGEQKIISEIKQIIDRLVIGLNRAELDTSSFTLPFTDLVVPSMTLSINKLLEFEIPTQLDIPQFTILGFHNVPAQTISFDDIKQRIVELINLISRIDIRLPEMEAFFGDLKINYFPAMPEMALPVISIPEISVPMLPHFPMKKLVETLPIPEMKMPIIPNEIMIPGFGKLYGNIRIISPMYTISNTAEVQSSLDGDNSHQLTAVLNSQATSPSFEMVNFNLDSTVCITVLNMHHVIASETLKFAHTSLDLEHHASVSLDGLSAQASTKTTMKATTEAYKAEFVNEAFFDTKHGMYGTIDTTYNHWLVFPFMSLTSETHFTQNAVVRQEATALMLTVGNKGTSKLNSHNGSHKSNLYLTINPSSAKMNLTSDTETVLLKMKQTLSADSIYISSFHFDARSEAEGPAIKNSLLVVSGKGNLHNMKMELMGTHDTELVGTISGVLSNEIHTIICPTEVKFDFQNKGNTRVSFQNAFTAKIDLLNNYSAIFKTGTQQINTVAQARFNQYKVFYNFTVDNNEREAGIFAAVDGEANLDFLTNPISIPEMYLPFIDFSTPAIHDLNLYDHMGLKHILITTKQTVDVNAKIVYQKSFFAPLVDVMGLTLIPSLGNTITELSLKSAIINLNVNTKLHNEEDFVFHLGATTASLFEGLKSKFDGTTRLTTKRGIKLANSLTMENPHIQGTHDSTVSVSTDNLETAMSVATCAKIALPILKLEANHNLVVDTKTKANTISTLKIRGDIDLPILNAIGKAEAEHNLKLDGTLEYVSMESTTKANIDATVVENILLLSALDHEANVYVNSAGLRSTSKIIAKTELTHGISKVLEMDVDEEMAVEASLNRIYALLKFSSNNEGNMMTFKTKGKHVAQATINIAPISSLTADIEIDMSQPSSLGNLSILKKTVIDMTVPKQEIHVNGTLATPVYTTNLAVGMEGNAPVFKVTFKSSATSPIVFLEYDLDSTITTTFKNAALSMISKALYTHADLTIDVQHALAHATRKTRLDDGIDSRLTLNVDITSPTFTDMNFRLAARKDGVSASVSTPSTGFLGLQFYSRVPSQIGARLYGRYASAPGKDVDIFLMRTSARDADWMSVKVTFNMEAPEIMIIGLREKLPAITYSFMKFGEKYQLSKHVAWLKNAIIEHIREISNTANNHGPNLSQLSILFRNTIVQYQKTLQVFLDAAIKFVRETQFKLPGSVRRTTIPEVYRKLTLSFSAVLENAIQVVVAMVEHAFGAIIDMIGSIQVSMPVGDVMTAGNTMEQLKSNVKTSLKRIVNRVKRLESPDMLLVKLGETMDFIVDVAKKLIDNTLKSNILDPIVANINSLYSDLMNLIKHLTEHADTILSRKNVNSALVYMVDVVRTVVNIVDRSFSDHLRQSPAELKAHIKLEKRRLEINFLFPQYQ